MKKRVLCLILALFMTSSMAIFMSACGKQEAEGGTTGTQTNAETTKEVNTDPLGKYEQPIEITYVTSNNPSNQKLPSGTTAESNSYIDLCRDKLGINVKVLWSAPSDQFDQKLNLSISSGETPDIMPLNAQEFEMVKKADSIADLTQVYDQYALPEMKKWLSSDGGAAMNASAKDGKLLALPQYNDTSDYLMLPFIRKDWLSNLNLSEPQNLNDLFNVAEAFATSDPDKNGKNDTVGIGICKDLIGWVYDTTAIFNGYHAYPDIWIKGSDGNLAYGSVQPEMKAPLLKLQELYKKGIIDKEFGVKDVNKIVEENTAGKFGIMFGQWYTPGWPLQSNMDKDPKADWVCLTNFSIDDKPALYQTQKVAINRYSVISKKSKNPEALIKMANLFYDMTYNPEADTIYAGKNKPEGGFEYSWCPVMVWQSTSGQEYTKLLKEAVEAKDPSKLPQNASLKGTYDSAIKYQSGDRSQWGNAYQARPDSPRAIIGNMLSGKQIIYNEFFGPPTATMQKKEATLKTKLIDGFTKIIMGSATGDDFDKLVADWKAQGGDDITKEVNDWYGNR